MNWMSLTKIGALVMVLASLLGCGRDADSFNDFTQCIKGVDEPLLGKELLYQDAERRCYGVQWKIPGALWSGKIVAYNPISESVSINVDDKRRRKLADQGLQGLLPPVLTRRVEVLPVFDTPERRVAHLRAAYSQSMKLADSEQRFGFITKKSTLPNHQEDVLLYPDDVATLTALCRPVPREDGSQQIERTSCDVWSAFAHHLMVRYQVPYSDLPRLREIDAEMTAWVQKFMIRKNA